MNDAALYYIHESPKIKVFSLLFTTLVDVPLQCVDLIDYRLIINPNKSQWDCLFDLNA